MKAGELTIVLPFEQAEKLWQVWAGSENDIDFRLDRDAAVRCTMAYGVLELKSHLQRVVRGLEITVLSVRPAGGAFIELDVEQPENIRGAFRFIPEGEGLIIRGIGRNGLLNGVYELLRLQGCRWIEPGERGDVIPTGRAQVELPSQSVEIQPSFESRSLDIYLGPSKESANLVIWMARNGLNCFTVKDGTAGLGRKLGMTMKKGGHLLQLILAPDRRLPSGETVWEAHREWYGTPATGEKRKELAFGVQCCVSQPSLTDFVGRELVDRINGAWSEVDIIDLWGFDSTGGGCCCPDCSGLGNTSDKMLLFLSGVRQHLDRALDEGRLSHRVRLTITAYDGTGTLEPPSQPVPENIVQAGDIGIFYPITRCYRHDFSDAACPYNSDYNAGFTGWSRAGMPLWFGEYYSVSKFEDLPLLFSRRMAADIPFYHACGAAGVTYMHPPLANWGVRALTQVIYARLLWDVDNDVAALVEEYLEARYGVHAPAMRGVYRKVEEAWSFISQWRNWHGGNALAELLKWDGRPPAEALKIRHFPSQEEAIASGRDSIAGLTAALETVSSLVAAEKERNCRCVPEPGAAAVNPEEQERNRSYDTVEYRLSEDRRQLIYGLDMMILIVLLVEYHLLLLDRDRDGAAAAWEKIEGLADWMDSYYMMVRYEKPGPGIINLDALTRSQLRPVIARCRRARADEAGR